MRSHRVERLDIHDAGQWDPINDEQLDEDLINIPQKRSKLEAYFELNKIDPKARKLLYWQIPEHYTWHPKESEWRPKGKDVKRIGRIYFVNPNQDLFYLRYRFLKFKYRFFRLLLLHVKGAKSHKDLRKVNIDGIDVQCQNYVQACRLLGLAFDDQEWYECMKEAATSKKPSQLRTLFATILIQNMPAEPLKLWETFRNELSEDFLHKYPENPEKAYNSAYKLIAHKLNMMQFGPRNFQYFVKNFGMPSVNLDDSFDEKIDYAKCKTFI